MPPSFNNSPSPFQSRGHSDDSQKFRSIASSMDVDSVVKITLGLNPEV